MTVLETISAYLQARAVFDEAHAASQRAYKLKQDAEYELVSVMVSDGVPSINLDATETRTGANIGLRKKYGCAVTKDNEAQIREWLMETEGDDSRFVHEKVNKEALLEWMKEQGKEPDDVPAFIKLNTRPGITVRGWKTRT
jgi:metal-sulfur cluster biosynthetic enzyme